MNVLEGIEVCLFVVDEYLREVQRGGVLDDQECEHEYATGHRYIYYPIQIWN